MKIRKGFVSNSSSSSFLIVVPSEKKENWKDLPDFFMKEEGLIFPMEEVTNWKDDDYVNEEVVTWVYNRKDKFDNGNTLLYVSVEYGCEDSFYKLFNKLNLDYLDIE